MALSTVKQLAESAVRPVVPGKSATEVFGEGVGQVVRSVDVPYEGSKRAYPLVENYTEDKAKKMKDNDTSFMVSGSIDRAGESDDYSFTASDSEFVTINLVPEKQLDAFDMVIRSDDGSVLFESKSQQSTVFVHALPSGWQICAGLQSASLQSSSPQQACSAPQLLPSRWQAPPPPAPPPP